MELRPSTKNRQNYLISFLYFLYYNKLYTNNQLANNVTVYWLTLLPKMSLNWACSQLHSRLQSSNDFNRRWGVAMLITVCFDLRHPDSCTGRRRWWDVEHSPFTVVDTGLCGRRTPLPSKALFVASHWLERFSSQFSVTLLVFSRPDHSTLQVQTTFYVVLSQLF